MTKKNSNHQDSQFSVKHALETLRSKMVDLEARAHAAEELLQHLPYMPRSADPNDAREEARINVGRLQSLVVATADEARLVLKEMEALIERFYHPTSSNGSSKAGESWRPWLARPRDTVLASLPAASQSVRDSA